MNQIANALDIFRTEHGNYPDPDDYVDIQNGSGELVAYQGIFDGSAFNQGIRISKIPKDPKDNEEYTYTKILSPQPGFEIGCLIEGGQEVSYKPVGDSVYASSIRSPYIIQRNNMAICNAGNMRFPSILSMVNNKEGKFLRLNNAVAGTSTGCIVKLDFNNLTGSCDGTITAPILEVLGDDLNIGTGDIEPAIPGTTFTERGIYVEFINPDNETIICTGCVSY